MYFLFFYVVFLNFILRKHCYIVLYFRSITKWYINHLNWKNWKTYSLLINCIDYLFTDTKNYMSPPQSGNKCSTTICVSLNHKNRYSYVQIKWYSSSSNFWKSRSFFTGLDSLLPIFVIGTRTKFKIQIFCHMIMYVFKIQCFF